MLTLCSLISFCMLWGQSVGDTITPEKDAEQAAEGSKVKLSCRYSSSQVYSLLWYRQYPGSAPQFLILENSGVVNNPIPGLSIQHVQEQSRVDLEISSAEVTDSALYYEGSKVTLSYNYSKTTVGDYFFWYRQDPGKPPEFLLMITGTEKSAQILKSDSRISTKLTEDKRGVDLEISSAAVTHSALYYCARILVSAEYQAQRLKVLKKKYQSMASGNSINPEATEEHVVEGGNITFTCKYDGSINNIQWYRQYPRSRPEFLLYITEGGSVHEAVPGFSAHIDKQEKRVTAMNPLHNH
ncbi:uncharacterized protein LOC115375386 [Myripristis murdjan]|uniref:uncharacterized protein LOC115375386 n=1 Tax=Myripristis murdjan TaxID=586833 RepID=UPI0011760AA8|nr:uncharacterized protein LOC115375386 [Myripristis murdjan]